MTLNHQDSQTKMMFESSSSSSTTTPVSILSLDQRDSSLHKLKSSIEANTETRNDQNLSEYEKLRARNIERNNKRMVTLGLMTEEEALLANQKAWEKTNDDLEAIMKFKDDRTRHQQTNSNRLSTNETLSNRISSNKRNNKIDNNRKENNHRGYSSTVNDAKSNSRKKEGVRTRSRVLESTIHSNKTKVEGSRKSSRKRARMPYEVEGIWI